MPRRTIAAANPCQIADHAAAKGDHHVAAFKPCIEDRSGNGLDTLPAFGAFAGRYRAGAVIKTRFRQATLDGGEMVAGNVRVGHDQGADTWREGRKLRTDPAQKVGADHNVIAALAKRDRDDRLIHACGFHDALSFGSTWAPSASRHACTTSLWTPSRDGTVISAKA